MLTWMIIAAGMVAVAWVNWYFFLAPKGIARSQTADDGIQEMNITVDGGYSPSAIRLTKGMVRLVFDRREKSPCSEELVISEFGIRRFLKPFEKTVIEFVATRSGDFEFSCGMNMLRGRMQVED